MGLIVQKFGGTSLATIKHFQNAAGIVYAELKAGHKPIVVVSAMSGVTNQLVNYIRQIVPPGLHTCSEYGAVVSAGEQVSAGLMSLCLQQMGVKARSFLGWQVPIVTDNNYTDARILSVDPDALMRSVSEDEVPVVAGFQGTCGNRITTLGRGGSDVTAVAIAGTVGAERCDIYTDVDGVFTADPRIVTRARRLPQITYDEMYAMALSGAKVLHPVAADSAQKNKLLVRILHKTDSSFKGAGGTIIVSTLNDYSNRRGSVVGIATREVNQLDMAELHNLEFDQKSLSTVSVIGSGSVTSSILSKISEIMEQYSIVPLACAALATRIVLFIRAEFRDLVMQVLHSGLGLDA